LQRLLKINVVHSRTLVKKNGLLNEATEANALVIFLLFLRWQVDKKI